MKISMIELVSSHGGMNYYDYGLMAALANQGHEVTLFTSSELKFDISNNKNLNVDLVYSGLFTSHTKLTKIMKFIQGTYQAIHKTKKNGCRIVHFQIFSITFLELFVVWLCKRNKLKVIVTVHDVESFSKKNSKRIAEEFYKRTDSLVVHNKISYDTLVEFLRKIPNSEGLIKNCNIVHHGSYIGLLPQKIDKAKAKVNFNLSSNTFVFLFFGQIKKVKGLEILLEAYSKLLKGTSKKVMLLIAGKVWKDDFSIYEKIILENNLTEYIHMDIKYIPDEDIVNYYSAADCLVLPYKKIFQSGVLLMAQSYNIPVIVSNLQGMTEIIDDGENGFVFESENSDSLCKKMCDVLNYSNLEGILEKSYAKLEKEYDWNTIASQQVVIMKAILDK